MGEGKVGRHYKWRKFEFWAQGGRVYYLDTELIDDDSVPLKERCRSLSPKEFLKRIIALYAVHSGASAASVRAEFTKLREDAEACAKEAKKQGDITDPVVQADLVKAAARRSHIAMPTSLFGSVPDRQPPPPQDAALAGVSWTFKNDTPEKMFNDGYKLVPRLG